MPDIKTKETIKDIKALDKSANFAARLRATEISLRFGAVVNIFPKNTSFTSS